MSTMEHDAKDQPITNTMQPQKYRHHQTWSLTDCACDGTTYSTTRQWSSMTSMHIDDFDSGLRHPPLRPGAASYDEDEIAKFRRTCEWMDQMNLHRTKMIPSHRDVVSLQNNRGLRASLDGNNNFAPPYPILPSPEVDSSYHSISNSNCVPVEGRLVDLADNEYYSADDGSENGGGIEILAESTEDEYDEPSQSPQPQLDNRTNLGIETLSMYENDSIVVAAAARVNENFVAPANGHESIDFEQLFHVADDRNPSDAVHDDDGAISDTNNHGVDSDQDIAGQSFWRRRNPFSLTSATKADPRQSQQTPARARSTHHDKYVVEIDILSSETNSSSLEIRDVMDIMANMELLHLWFVPIPAIFETTFKDGNTEGYTTSPRSSPSNSLEANSNNTTSYHNNRQYDGQWVEISTPPLKIPPGAWLSGCSRSVRVAFRSMIGFPARIRSMIFVERSCGRMGMTLGPYPDGFLCNSGTMAYHTFRIRISNEEDGSCSGTSRRYVTISDEVRLQRDQDNDFNGIRRSCCLCLILRFMLGLLERAILIRWYKPDLASYMQQTVSSMEKLRSLVERGESAAYHGGELIMNDEEWQGGSDNGTLRSPLLG